MPPFILLFVVAVAVASLGVLPDRAIDRLDQLRTVLLGLALFAVGDPRSACPGSRGSGRVPLVLGLASWVLIAVVSYAGVRLAWP